MTFCNQLILAGLCCFFLQMLFKIQCDLGKTPLMVKNPTGSAKQIKPKRNSVLIQTNFQTYSFFKTNLKKQVKILQSDTLSPCNVVWRVLF